MGLDAWGSNGYAKLAFSGILNGQPLSTVLMLIYLRWLCSLLYTSIPSLFFLSCHSKPDISAAERSLICSSLLLSPNVDKHLRCLFWWFSEHILAYICWKISAEWSFLGYNLVVQQSTLYIGSKGISIVDLWEIPISKAPTLSLFLDTWSNALY